MTVMSKMAASMRCNLFKQRPMALLFTPSRGNGVIPSLHGNFITFPPSVRHRPQILKLPRTTTTTCKRSYASTSSAYYVLLPEIPPDTSETNPIMRLHEFPRFSEISPDCTITGCAKLSIEFDVAMGKHIESLNERQETKTFEALFDPMERLSMPLNYAWRTAKHLNYVCQATGFREAFSRVHPQVERAKNERWVNHTLYHLVKEVNAERSKLNDNQRRMIDMYLLEARLNGIELTGADKKQFIQFLGKLVEAKSHFRNRVSLSHNLFSHNIYDPSELDEMPQQLLNQLFSSHRPPWRVNLNHNVYSSVMQYCSNRMTRWNLWQAFNNRASVRQDEQNLSNHLIIENIREHRRDIAKLLKYKNFAQMSMETKMAGSIENVLAMLNATKAKFESLAAEEVTALQEFARSEGFSGGRLELWDLPYWRRRQRDHLYKVGADIHQYFPYPQVLAGLFNMCTTLFDITIVDCTGEVDVWHPDVSFYRVYNGKTSGRGGQQEVAAFYIDPYSRPAEKLTGTWMESGREHSRLLGTTPFSYFNLNLTAPVRGSNQPTMLLPDQISSLFHEFGHGLQQMLTTVPYSEISGQRNVEWDCLQTCAKLLEMFLHNPRVVRHLGTNHSVNGGQSISNDLVTTLIASQQHMSAYDTMRQLYLSALDLELYTTEEHWQHVVKRVWSQYMPLPLNDKEEDNHLCSMTAIFSDPYPAAYYSLQWSEMLAADIYEAFDEVGDDMAALGVVGRKFRDTYLSLGGGVAGGEVFRRFRGRDPSLDALVRQYTNNRNKKTNIFKSNVVEQ